MDDRINKTQSDAGPSSGSAPNETETQGPGQGADRPERKPLVPVPVLVAVIFAIAVLIPLLWWTTREKPKPVVAPPTKDELAYLSQIGVSDLHLSAEQNLIGSEVVYVDGKITNNGSQTIQQLRIRTYFHDSMGQVVLREERDIIRPGESPIAASQSRDFQLRYDNLPKSWNIQLPDFRLASIKLQ